MTTGGRFADAGVLVTGASRGLGRVVAQRFAEEGARVGIGYRTNRKEAEHTAELVGAAGGTSAVLELDVRDRASVRHAFAEFEERGPLDVLVNNAAVALDRPFAMLGEDDWNAVVTTNLTGTFHCARAAVSSMTARGRGSIVNISSVAGIRASPGQANYAASKAGVIGLTMTLAAEVARYGIRVNAVVPGLLRTGMAARLDHRILEQQTARIPLGRLGEGEEVAAAVLFLASDEASYMVGQVVTVDGGLSL